MHITMACGFQSACHFSKSYRDAFSTAPTRGWRKQPPRLPPRLSWRRDSRSALQLKAARRSQTYALDRIAVVVHALNKQRMHRVQTSSRFQQPMRVDHKLLRHTAIELPVTVRAWSSNDRHVDVSANRQAVPQNRLRRPWTAASSPVSASVERVRLGPAETEADAQTAFAAQRRRSAPDRPSRMGRNPDRTRGG